MDITNKKTALDDEAALYKHETDSMSEGEKLKNMNGAQKWQHFKQYYLLKVVLVLAGAGVLTAILISVFKPKKEVVFYACVFNGCINRDKVYSLRDDFDKTLDIDMEKYATTFDQDFIYSGPYGDAVNRFVVLTRSGKATVAIMPESVYKIFAGHNYFEKIEDVLTEDELEFFKDRLAFTTLLDDEDKEIEETLCPYGIIIDECPALAGETYKEPVVIAFLIGEKTNKYGKDFLNFLFANE